MAYYTALITAWSSGTPTAVNRSGTSTAVTTISSGMTTQQKLTTVNGWNITGSIPSSITVSGAQIANCINWSEFATLDSTQRRQVLDLCAIPGALLGGSGNTTLLTAGMITATFPTSGVTIANLTALAQSSTIPWWQTPQPGGGGLTSPVSTSDLDAAGGLT